MRRLLLLVILLTSNLFAASAPPTVASVTALRALLPGAYPTVQLLGYNSAGDGGGGFVHWVAASTKAAAACSVYVPSLATSKGRWERPASPFRLARQCGVMTMDDTISGIITYPDLAGSGTRMVVVSATGTTSTQSIPAGGSLANPTGTIGLAAVNGSATSGMRSDGAPALSQAIVPTWSGVHTFTPAPIFSSVTASQVLLVDGSKALTSSATTGTGSFMRAASPTTTGTFTGETSNWSNTMTMEATQSTAWSGLGVPGVGNSEWVSFAHGGASGVNMQVRSSGTGVTRGIAFGFDGSITSLQLYPAGNTLFPYAMEVGGILTHAATAKIPTAFGTTTGTIAIDAALSDFYKVTLTGNSTLANPTNSGSTNVRSFTVRVKQDATGGRTLGYGTDYRFPGGVVPDLTTDANAVDYLSFILDEDADKWDFVGNAFNLLPAGT